MRFAPKKTVASMAYGWLNVKGWDGFFNFSKIAFALYAAH